jgi:undecaprenyl-phosphate 4-deoxy-4-formamido-L-arabinose transferase
MSSSEEPLDVTIIFSVHNEEGNLVPLTERTISVMDRYPHVHAWEIIIVDDASDDDSLEVMERLADRYPNHVRIQRHQQNQGKKGTFMTGFANARGWLSVVMDADLQALPEELPAVLDKAFLEGSELVSTYSDRSRPGERPGFVSAWAYLWKKVIFNSRFREESLRFTAVETRYIKGVKLIAGDHRYLLQICIRRGVTRIGDVGCVFGKRVYGRSDYNKWKKAFTGLPQMLALKLRLLKGYYDEPAVQQMDRRLVTAARVDIPELEL